MALSNASSVEFMSPGSSNLLTRAPLEQVLDGSVVLGVMNLPLQKLLMDWVHLP